MATVMERLSEIAANRHKHSIRHVSFFTRLMNFFEQFRPNNLTKYKKLMTEIQINFAEKATILGNIRETYELTKSQESTLEFLLQQAETYANSGKEPSEQEMAIFDEQFNELESAVYA